MTAFLISMTATAAGCGLTEDDSLQNENTGDSDTDADGTTDSNPQNEICEVGDLSGVCAKGSQTSVMLSDMNNYSFSSSLDIATTVVRGGSPIVDLTFDWSAVTVDFLGQPLNPLLDINMTLVSAWALSQTEILELLNTDQLNQTKLLGALMAYPGDVFTSENLLDFTLLGNPITDPADVATRDSYFNAADPGYDPALYTHMVMLQSEEATPGKDVRMIKFFTLDANATETQINISSADTKLNYEVDIRSLHRVPVPTHTPGISVSWENVYQTTLGTPFIPTKVSRVVVAHYAMSVCQLENTFLDLERIYDQWYQADLENVSRSFSLTDLKSNTGMPFPGITPDGGTWILGLFCTLECSNPAPIFMTVLNPC